MSQRKFPSYPTKLKIAVDHGGKCAFCGPDSPRLFPNLKGEQLIGIRVGKFAHINSESENGPRYNPDLSEEKLASRFNFLYVCEEHHSLIDDNESEYDEEYLKKTRDDHTHLIIKKLEGTKVDFKYGIITLEDNFFGKINRSTILDSIGDIKVPILDMNIPLQIPHQDFKIDWIKSCKLIRKKWNEFQKALLDSNRETELEITPDEYHIYSITKIPFAIYFGALIQETNKYILHQWRRRGDEQTWVWNQEKYSSGISIKRPSRKDLIETDPIILKIEISAKINNGDIEKLGLPLNNIFCLSVQNLNRNWLQTQIQLHQLCKEYRNLFERINTFNLYTEIHLFYSGPIPLAIFIGQIFSPRMDSPLIIYNWQRDKDNKKKYFKIFELGEILLAT